MTIKSFIFSVSLHEWYIKFSIGLDDLNKLVLSQIDTFKIIDFNEY